jgi:cytochrome c oxidase assembly factor 2
MVLTADGQQVPRVRRRRRKDAEMVPEGSLPGHPTPAGSVDDEVSTFLQMEEEAETLSHINRECPVPKPKGVLGELLGFRNVQVDTQHQASGLSNGDR